MATFEYTARVDPSRMQEGTIEAESAMSAARHLKAQGLYTIRDMLAHRTAIRFAYEAMATVPAGMGALQQDGWKKVKVEITSLSEVLRVSHADEFVDSGK